MQDLLILSGGEPLFVQGKTSSRQFDMPLYYLKLHSSPLKTIMLFTFWPQQVLNPAIVLSYLSWHF